MSFRSLQIKTFFADPQVARDHSVKGWSFTEDLGEVDTDYGSGYPGGKVEHMKNQTHQELPASPQRRSTLYLYLVV